LSIPTHLSFTHCREIQEEFEVQTFPDDVSNSILDNSSSSSSSSSSILTSLLLSLLREDIAEERMQATLESPSSPTYPSKQGPQVEATALHGERKRLRHGAGTEQFTAFNEFAAAALNWVTA
jgi:hypothetical protein